MPADRDPDLIRDFATIRDRILQIAGPRRAIVRLDGTRVGTLRELGTGTRFVYDPAYLDTPGALPLAPTLPLRAEPYDSPGLHPIFAGLLPEGWPSSDEFGLLLATGEDTIGAIEVIPE